MPVYLLDDKVLLDGGHVATSSNCCCGGGGCACCHDVTVSLEITASIMCDSHILLSGHETRSHSFTQSCDREDFNQCEDSVDLNCNDASNCDSCLTEGQHRCGVLAVGISKQCLETGVVVISSAEMGCSDCTPDSCDPDTCYETHYFVNCSGNTHDDYPDGLPEGVTVLNYHCESVFEDCSLSCTATMDIAATFTVGPLGPCPMGACCNDTDCTITSEADCTGVYQGDNTVCDPNPCAAPTGACCNCFGIPGFCIDGTDASTCASAFHGTYAGDGSVCPCP